MGKIKCCNLVKYVPPCTLCYSIKSLLSCGDNWLVDIIHLDSMCHKCMMSEGFLCTIHAMNSKIKNKQAQVLGSLKDTCTLVESKPKLSKCSLTLGIQVIKLHQSSFPIGKLQGTNRWPTVHVVLLSGATLMLFCCYGDSSNFKCCCCYMLLNLSD